jgi:SAM-dependent methyltransferase
LYPYSSGEKSLLLKSDLWNEGVDGSSGNIYDFLGESIRQVKIVGIDISSFVCTSASWKTCHDESMFACGNVELLPFKSDAFNTIFDLSTLDHVSPTLVETVITEYERVLKEGGILAIVFDVENLKGVRHLQKIFNGLRYKDIHTFDYSWRFYPEWIEAKLTGTGFTILHGMPVGILSLSPLFLKAAHISRRSNTVRKLLYILMKNINLVRASRIILPLATQYLFVAMKKGVYSQSRDKQT